MIFSVPRRDHVCYHCKKSMKLRLRGLLLLAAITVAVCIGIDVAVVNIFHNATAVTVFIINVLLAVIVFFLRPFFVSFTANEKKKR